MLSQEFSEILITPTDNNLKIIIQHEAETWLHQQRNQNIKAIYRRNLQNNWLLVDFTYMLKIYL